MASVDQRVLAQNIRDVHENLRRSFHRSKIAGNEKADITWDDHCNKSDVLQQYAASMKKLATTYWQQNNTSTRIDWCNNAIRNYYLQGGLQTQLEKDFRITALPNEECNVDLCNIKVSLPINLLDVGSCYNPFKDFEEFHTIAIDLCPATSDVFQCDFLKLKVSGSSNSCSSYQTDETTTELSPLQRHLPSSLNTPLCSLPAQSFQAVVFSLLLEYMPCAHQRLQACIKAGNLLAENGLLLIVTPDSKHETHNSRMMKSWRIALATLGFARWRYEKTKHLHCMAFRKLPTSVAVVHRRRVCGRAARGDDVVSNETLASMLYIPQDFNDHSERECMTVVKSNRLDNEYDAEIVRNGFSELASDF